MNKEDYIKIVNEKLTGNSKQIMLNQIDRYYNSKNYIIKKQKRMKQKQIMQIKKQKKKQLKK